MTGVSNGGSGRSAKPESSLKLLVTGAAGFIGSHLCEQLLENGHWVWGLDNFDDFYSPRTKRDNIRRALAHPRMRLVEGDVRDRVLLHGLFSDRDFDGVIHLAARPGVRPSIDQPETCFDVNVTGTMRLLEIMQERGVPRLVFGSSSSVYGQSEKAPFRESEAADRPISPYAASKRTGELLCHTYHDLYGLSVISLRFFTVFGPRQRPDLAIHKFARLMERGDPLPLFGDGTSRRDYTYVSDIVDGVVASVDRLAAAGPAPLYEIVNLGRSDPISLKEMVSKLSKAMGVTPTIERLKDQPGDVSLTCASQERARDLLGYRPTVSFEEGLRRFVAWLRGADGDGAAPVPKARAAETESVAAAP